MVSHFDSDERQMALYGESVVLVLVVRRSVGGLLTASLPPPPPHPLPLSQTLFVSWINARKGPSHLTHRWKSGLFQQP